MNDITSAITAAWEKVRPRLERDPDELNRRLARRRAKLINSPPRAWCLAVRAADLRIEDTCAVFDLSSRRRQELGLDDSAFDHAHPPQRVMLDSDALRQLCAPVRIPSPGLPVADVARLLGVKPCTLRESRLKGVFQTHHIACHDAHWGKPHPILYSPEPLDPSQRGFTVHDPVWSFTAAHFVESRLPDDILQTLTRISHHANPNRRYAIDKENLHPEHPDVDGVPPRGASKRRGRHYPAPDLKDSLATYKWKDGKYLGYDWRVKGARERYRKRQRRLLLASRAAKRRRRENPRESKANGDTFRGYKWLCPACNKKVNVLFLPLPRLHLLPLDDLKSEISNPESAISNLKSQIARADAESKSLAPPQTFACEKCHRIKRSTRCDPNAWNEIIAYLTAGLLYGHEVPRPQWFPKSKRADRMTAEERASISNLKSEISNVKSQIPNRKFPFTPRPTREPSHRRPQIEHLLLAGKTFKEIARELNLVYGTILWHAQQVYKQHGVRSLEDLLRKHGHDVPERMTKDVRRRLLAGESIPDIDRALRCGKTIIYNQRQQLRKEGIKLPDARDTNRVGGKISALFR